MVHVLYRIVVQHLAIAFVYKYMYNITYLRPLYVHMYVISVTPSVTEAVATLVTPNENRTEHSITVTCTVHHESVTDMCVVMAMADGRPSRTGKYGKSQKGLYIA